MAEIFDPNYETISTVCDRCGVTCIFNRIDDLEELMPISGRRVRCFSCGGDFWINGDTINSAYEFLIDDAKEHFKVKRYMPAIASLAQAWEVFFSAAALSTYVYRPFFSESPARRRRIENMNDAVRSLHDAINSFTWYPLRNLAMNMILSGARPTTMADAKKEIAMIPTWRSEPAKKAIAAVVSDRRRRALEDLASLSIGRLRNDVVHKFAYRPRRDEVQPCLTSEISGMYRAKHLLGVGGFLEHQAGLVYEEA